MTPPRTESSTPVASDEEWAAQVWGIECLGGNLGHLPATACARIRAEIASCFHDARKSSTPVVEARWRMALEFYAEKLNYNDYSVEGDQGETARTALDAADSPTSIAPSTPVVEALVEAIADTESSDALWEFCKQHDCMPPGPVRYITWQALVQSSTRFVCARPADCREDAPPSGERP